MKLEKYRKINKLSYEQLGTLLGMSKVQAWRLCKGSAKDPRLSEVKKIIKATDGAVTLDDFDLKN